MRIPVIQGVIERRILANYRIDAQVAQRALPDPFRPKLVDGYAIGGVCLIRLAGVRPRGLPAWMGIGSENGAHRFAVEWDSPEGPQEGVYIPRRDTSSALNALVGGRLFPGVHSRAVFSVSESADALSVAFAAVDGGASVEVEVDVAPDLPAGSVFASLGEASAFFEAGSLGYSVSGQPGLYDGLELRTKRWDVTPLTVRSLRSSFFDDEARFPRGACELDCALLMRDIDHEWHGRDALRGCV